MKEWERRYLDGGNPFYPMDEEWEKEKEDDSKEPTHRCQWCGTRRRIDDYQTYTPSWCEWCEQVRPHESLDEDD